MLVTAGFRDVYEIGRANRPEMYDIHWRRPPMLLRRRDIVELAGRLAADGSVLEPLDEAAVREAARGLAGEYDAVAVCLLHAYADPAHEQRVAELVREEAPGLVVVCSHEVAPRVARVRALVVDRRLGLRDARDRRLPLAARRAAGGAGARAAAARDAVERRRHLGSLVVRRAANTLFSGPVGGTIAAVASRATSAPSG